MADTQIGGLPLVTTAPDSAILHIQEAGIDKSITKVSFLKELKAEVDTNTTALAGSLATAVSDNTTRSTSNEQKVALLENWTARGDKVITYSTNSTLVTGQVVNEFVTTVTGTLPLANTVAAGTICIVAISETNKAHTPTIVCSGGDTITYSGGTDTSLQLDLEESVTLTFVSDGTSTWRM